MDASKIVLFFFFLIIYKRKRAPLGHLSLLRQVPVRRVFIFDIYSHSKFTFGAKKQRERNIPSFSFSLRILFF